MKDDAKSIKHALKLVKEQGESKIEVRATDPAKRQTIMKEAYRQDMKVHIPRKAVKAEFSKAVVAVEREKAIEKYQNSKQPDKKDRERDRRVNTPVDHVYPLDYV